MSTELALKSAKDMARETLVGDVRDLALQHITQAVAWKAMPEATQQRIINDVSRGAQEIIDKVVEIIASDGQDRLTATIEQITIKEGIKISAKLPMTEHNLLELCPRQGSSILIVVAESAKYSGTRGDVHAEPDQPQLPMSGVGPDPQWKCNGKSCDWSGPDSQLLRKEGKSAACPKCKKSKLIKVAPPAPAAASDEKPADAPAAEPNPDLHCGKCGKDGHLKADCPILCDNCGDKGHTADDCPKAKGKGRTKKGDDKPDGGDPAPDFQ